MGFFILRICSKKFEDGQTLQRFLRKTSQLGSLTTNAGKVKSTKSGIPWIIIYTEEHESLEGAVKGKSILKMLLEEDS